MSERTLASRVGAVVIVVALIAGAFLVGSAAGGFSLFGSAGGEPYTEVGDSVVESVRSMAQLTSVEMVEYTTIEKGTDHGWLNWANKDQIFMLAVARIGAGVDLQGLSPSAFDVDETGVVWVELPPAEVAYVALDNRATQVYSRETGLFTEGNPQLESEARLTAEGILRQSALDHGILDVARENAETAIRELLLALGYEDVRFTPPLAAAGD